MRTADPREFQSADRWGVGRLPRLGFVPFAFGYPTNLARLAHRPLDISLTLIRSDTAAGLAFHRTLNRLNALAFGGMGMPAWVQLDCGVLPSAFVGWARQAKDLPADLRTTIAPEAALDDLVPVAEALAIPTAEPGTWASISLASVWRGERLGVATKALALAAYGAQRTLGVCQYDSPALRVHTAFGPLRIVDPRVEYHSKPHTTFVYALDDVPAVLDGRFPSVAGEPVNFATDSLADLRPYVEASRSGLGYLWILPPGLAKGRVQCQWVHTDTSLQGEP